MDLKTVKLNCLTLGEMENEPIFKTVECSFYYNNPFFFLVFFGPRQPVGNIDITSQIKITVLDAIIVFINILNQFLFLYFPCSL